MPQSSTAEVQLMIKCLYCSHENPEGSLVCASCGQSLDRNTTITTRKMAMDTKPPSEPGRHEGHVGKLGEKGIAVYVGQAKEPMVYTIQERLTIGRRKDVALPDLIDLTSFDAYRMGVSRNHAVLTYKEGRFYVHDVGSVNGTWLNGQRLKPYELYPLQSGAAISLGQLIMYIYFQGAAPAAP